MSDASAFLQAYMADDPNLIVQPAGTGSNTNDLPGEHAQPSQDNTQHTATGTNTTRETTNTVTEGREQDVEMTNLQGGPDEAATEIGTVLMTGGAIAGLDLTRWIALRSDSETRKRKERSPSPVGATDGQDQSAETAGAHKRLRATVDSVTSSGVPAQAVENGSLDSQDSTTRPPGSGSEAPEQGLDAQSMPGALPSTDFGSGSAGSTASVDQSPNASTGGGAHPTGNDASATAIGPVPTNGLSIAVGHTPVVANNISVSGSSHAGPTSEVNEPSGGDGLPAKTTTPPASPPAPITDTGSSSPAGEARPMPPKNKTPSRDTPPPINHPYKNMLTTTNGASSQTGPRTTADPGPGGEASTDGSMARPVVPWRSPTNFFSSASSSATPNTPDPWAKLEQQFGGMRTEIRSMGTHIRTMSTSVGQLGNAVGIMADQHTELMSVLRMSLGQPFNPFAAAGQPPATGHAPAATTGQLSLAAMPAARQAPAPTLPRTTAPTAPRTPARSQLHATTSSHVSTPSPKHVAPSSSSRNRSSRPQASSDDDMEVDEGDVADTEGEIPEALPVVVKTSKLKLKGMPKARDPIRKALSDDIALMARKYMGREPDLEDEDGDVLFFDEAKVPTREEVRAFNGRDGQCCSIDDFRPDLEGTPKSTWNQSVAQVFAKEYVKANTAKSKDLKEVQQAFGTHMKSLINSYKTFQASGAVNEAKRRPRRRYMRKAYAHQRRMMTAASHDGLRRHVWVIQALGVQGMSSDESEHEGTQTFLRVIDVFHDAGHFTNGVAKSSKSGAHVHLRLPAKNTSERPAVSGLPLAAYNAAWLKDLSEFFRTRLNISNIQYQFTHPPEVMNEMMQLLKPPAADQSQQTIPPLH